MEQYHIYGIGNALVDVEIEVTTDDSQPGWGRKRSDER